MRRLSSPGCEPALVLSEPMTGLMTPPERAVLLGVAGASTRSVRVMPYASPRLLGPRARTHSRAIRRPRPVLVNPSEMKNAATISQMVGSEKPPSATSGSSVPVIIAAVRPTRATAPSGSGCRIRPSTVPVKMASSAHPPP